jgi:cytochrome c oxidase cbb3-type subunit 4
MKFKNYLTSIDNVSIYPLVSLLIFVVFFVLVTLYVFSRSKKEMAARSEVPFKK